MREAGLATSVRRIRCELGRRAAAQPARCDLDRPADGGVALLVRRAEAFGSVPRRLRAAQEVPRPGGVARTHLDLALERRVAELREPEAALVDEVEGDPVAAGRDRCA